MVAGTNSLSTDAMGEMYVLRYFIGLHKIYEPIAANLLCDRMEEMMAQMKTVFIMSMKLHLQH
jgi:hypothetical protein